METGEPEDHDNLNDCLNCPVGSYSAIEGRTSKCELCPEGKYSDSTGNDALSDCSNCPSGQTSPAGSSSSQCTNCEAGKYEVSNLCVDCPVGTFSAIAGNDEVGDCEPCTQGKFSSTTGNDAEDDCEQCKSGTYGATEGLTANSECSSCPMGTYSWFGGLTNATQCTLCPVGKFNPNTRQDDISACKQCPHHSIASSMGSFVCTPCPDNFFASLDHTTCLDKDLCPPQSVFDDVIHHCACERGSSGEIIDLAGECIACVNGTFKDTVGSATCTACPIGTNSSRNATAIDQCYCLPELWRRGDMSCGGCFPGTYGHDMVCVSCPPNMHSLDGATSIEECSCKAGTFQDPTEPGCINCGFGTYKEFEEDI